MTMDMIIGSYEYLTGKEKFISTDNNYLAMGSTYSDLDPLRFIVQTAKSGQVMLHTDEEIQFIYINKNKLQLKISPDIPQARTKLKFPFDIYLERVK